MGGWTWSMERLRRVIVAACVTVAAASCATASGGAVAPVPGQPTPATAVAAAQAFLSTYVRPSGQVVRLDQGGDTVSEGQAYGLLLAEVAGGDATFSRIWAWTRSHLALPDGLFAYHAAPSGKVIDAQPASDADLLIAWALLRYHGSGQVAFHRTGRAVAAAVLAHETTRSRRSGLLLLAGGPWATGRPASLDPSYWATLAERELAVETGNRTWLTLATDAVTATHTLTAAGHLLPPDWARLSGGRLRGEPAPNGSEPQTEYSLDAQRLVVWFATSKNASERSLAASWWPLLSGPQAGALARTPQGRALSALTAPLPYVAAAAAAAAAGHRRAEVGLLAEARRQNARHPTYYGSAWVALGLSLLDGTSLR